MRNMDLNKKNELFITRLIKIGFLVFFILMYLNFIPKLFLTRQKIVLFEQSRQEALNRYQKVLAQNKQLKRRLEAQEDPYYVEYLLRRKLNFKNPGEHSIPLNLEKKSFLLKD